MSWLGGNGNMFRVRNDSSVLDMKDAEVPEIKSSQV